jgi:hypothetical protein
MAVLQLSLPERNLIWNTMSLGPFSVDAPWNSNFTPGGSMARAANAGHCYFGAMGCDALTAAQKGRNGGGPVPTAKAAGSELNRCIGTGLPYQNRIITARVDRQKEVG